MGAMPRNKTSLLSLRTLCNNPEDRRIQADRKRQGMDVSQDFTSNDRVVRPKQRDCTQAVAALIQRANPDFEVKPCRGKNLSRRFVNITC
jgi:hypothetical protein